MVQSRWLAKKAISECDLKYAGAICSILLDYCPLGVVESRLCCHSLDGINHWISRGDFHMDVLRSMTVACVRHGAASDYGIPNDNVLI
jgi:hypothetical protein